LRTGEDGEETLADFFLDETSLVQHDVVSQLFDDVLEEETLSGTFTRT
jgi:hypothetical protein